METIKDTVYYSVLYNPDKDLIEVKWKPSILKLNIEEYEKVCAEAYEYLFTYKPKLLLQNTQDVIYPVTEELQNWLTENITKKIFVAVGIEKIAYIMPEDFLSKIGIEMLIEKANTQIPTISRMYFDNRPDAIEWLTKK